MNTKISVFVICVEAIIYLLLDNLYDCTFNIIKLNKNRIAKFMAESLSSCIEKDEVPSEIKHADIAPIHKNKDKNHKNNYRPASILSNYSKVCK